MHDDHRQLDIDGKLLGLIERGFIPSASIELTRQCNASCKYCYLPDDAPSQEMTTSQVKLAIDKLFEAGVISVGITGGEPMMRPDFNELFEYIFEKGFFFISLLTNGQLVKESTLALLTRYKDAGLEVRMSVFSMDPATNDAFMGIPGALHAILDTGEKLIKAGVNTGVLLNALEFNLAELTDAQTFFEKKGFKYAVGYEKSPIDPTRYDLGPVMEQEFFERFLAAAPRDALHLLMRDYALKMAETGELPETLCDGLSRTVTVFPNGDVAPCLSFRNLKLGNIIADDRSVRQILADSDALSAVKAVRKNDLACRDCEFKRYCLVCPGVMFSQHGDYTKPPQQTCNFAKAMRNFFEEHGSPLEIS